MDNVKFQNIELTNEEQIAIINKLGLKGDAYNNTLKLFYEKRYDRIDQMIKMLMNSNSKNKNKGYEAKKILDKALIREFSKALDIPVENLNKENIKKARKNKAKEYHPDNNDGKMNPKFYQLNYASQVLNNLIERNPDLVEDLKQESNNAQEVNEEQVKENIINQQLEEKEKIVEIIKGMLDKKYNPEELKNLNSQVINYLNSTLIENNVTKDNFAQFLHQQFDEVISKNIKKVQQKAVFDSIYSSGKVTLSLKDQIEEQKKVSIQSNNISQDIGNKVNINNNAQPISEDERPRVRLPYETDEEYVNYLQNFYEMRDFWKHAYDNDKQETQNQKADIIMKDPIYISNQQNPLGIEKKPDPLGIEKKPDPLGIPKQPDPLGIPQNPNPPSSPTPPSNEPIDEPKYETAATIIDSITSEIYDEKNEVQDIVGARKKDIRHLKYANIKVFDSFKNSFKNGNYIYNLNPSNITKAIISIPVNLAMKIYGNIGYGKKTKQRLEILQKRVDELTDKQVEIILKEHTAGQKQDMNFTNVVEELINRRVQKYQLKQLEKTNEFVDKTVADLIDRKSALDDIEKTLATGNLNEEQKNKLMTQKAKLLEGCKEKVAMIFEEKEKASQLVSHGFSEDTRAKFTKMGYLGKRFSIGQREIKTIEDQQFNHKLAELDRKVRHPKDDAEALNAFIENEIFYEENAEIKNGILGRRDTGAVKKNNRFIVKEQDYRADPLVGDIIRSTAIIASVVSVVSGVNAVKEAEQIRAEHNQNLNDINKHNQDTIDKIHTESSKITAQSQAMVEGAETISMSNTSNIGEFFHNLAERVERSKGGSYGKMDHDAHQLYADYMKNTQSAIQQFNQSIQSGSLTRSQVLEQYGQLNEQLVGDLSGLCQQYQTFMQQYPKDFSNFDYYGTLETMKYFSNPNSIKGLFDGMSQALSSAEAISNLNIQLAPLIEKLPNNLSEQITAAVSTVALAYYTSQKIDKGYEKGKYGKAQDKLEEYINKKKVQEEELQEDIDKGHSR